MAKSREVFSSENQPLTENKDLVTIGNLLEQTLNFVENTVDHPKQTRTGLKKQVWLVNDKLVEFYRNNLKILSESDTVYKTVYKEGKPDQYIYSVLREKDKTGKTLIESIPSYTRTAEGNKALTIERSKFISVKKPESKNKWRKILFQKYIIKIKNNLFENFEFYENKLQKEGIGVEITRFSEIKITYDAIGDPVRLKINMQSNPLKENEFFLGKPSVMKEKSLEIELF